VNGTATPLVCPDCRVPLRRDPAAWACGTCGRVFPVDAGIADFSGGVYSDVFSSERDVTPELVQCFSDEEAGTRARIADFYLPKLRRLAPGGRALRVLDCGCGNGLSVDLLGDAGIEAWGNDVSLVRKWQWRERRRPERLLIASGARLPFPEGYFDAVIGCGVLEHVGVIEAAGPPYTVRAAPHQRDARVAFLRELLRVVRAPGRLWVDFPNGRHPIDFWHGTGAGGARFHPLDEGFLPSVTETRELLASAGPDCRARAVSPYRRLRFKRVRRRWYGQLFSPAITAFFLLMRVPGLRWLAASPMNPFLVIEIEKPASGAGGRASSGTL
jgi:SAM-dependent methyltransferase